MRKAVKSSIEALAIISPFILLVITASFTIVPLSNGEPSDFYDRSNEVSLSEMLSVANQFNMTIYLPTEFPDNLKLTSVYLKDGPFIAILVYSANGNKDYKTSELTIQITPSSSPPTYSDLISKAESSDYETALEINDWPVIIDEKASAGGNEETRAKYGDFLLLVTAWIHGMRYMIVCPTITATLATRLVTTMSLLKL